MVAGSVIHVEWLNENRNRRYPFLDTASMRDQSGTVEVPDELLVDLTFPVNALEFDAAAFYLHSLTVFSGGIIVSIGYVGATAPIAVRAITLAEHTDNRTYYIEGVGDFNDCVGRIAVGRIDKIMDYGGTYTFDPTAAPLLPSVIRPTIRGISGLRIVSADNEESELLYGDVELIAGANITFDVAEVSPGVNELRISAVNNPDFESECECDDGAGDRRCIETINDIPPDADGNFDLTAVGCLTLTPQATGILMEDNCADPCCGCEELNVLRDELVRLNTQIATQEGFASRALSSIEQLNQVILAAKLGNINPCA